MMLMGESGLWEEVEKKVSRVIEGVEATLREFVERENLSVVDAKRILEELAPSFSLLAKKGVLEVLYTLLLLGPLSFTRILESTGLNRRTLSTRLKQLQSEGLVVKVREEGVEGSSRYALTEAGKATALLAIPLIYYISKQKRRGDLR